MKFAFAIFLFVFPGIIMATEEPSYEVIAQESGFELRKYSPVIIAETLVSGSMDGASGRGFEQIADYIFGNNDAGDGASEKISMTSPVTMKPSSDQISMTSSVSMMREDGKWRVHFVMPSKYSLESLPKPNNNSVVVKEVPETHYAVIRFSGFAGEKKVANKTAELLAYMGRNKLTASGNPELARYDPPWTLPMMRRNEVMVSYKP